MNQKNKLLITTHSPYLLEYLNCCIFEKKLQKQGLVDEKIDSVIPVFSLIDSNDVVVYQLDNNGNIAYIQSYEGMPSDTHILNQMLNDTNTMCYKLLQLKDELECR